jgi:hypothetical protein
LLDLRAEFCYLHVSAVGHVSGAHRDDEDEAKYGDRDVVDGQEAVSLSVDRPCSCHAFIPPATFMTWLNPARSSTLAATLDR